jgi:hypothetical protein
MGRDYKKNKNITMPIDRNSQVLQDLIEDAEKHGMSDQIGVFARIRLTEYYEARKRGRILPEGAAIYPATPWATMAATATPPVTPQYGGGGNGHHTNAAASVLHGNSSPSSSSEPSAADLERLADRPEVIELNTDDDDDDDGLSYFLDQEEEEEE